MKEHSVLSTIYENICRDTGKQNESAKLIAVVRMLTLSMLIHSFVCCILVSLTGHTEALAFSLISPVLFLAIFVLSYRCGTFVSYCILNVCTLFWTVMNVYYFGWNIGIQHFLVVLLVFLFFSKYRHEAAKIIYCVFLFALRLILYYYCRSHEPIAVLDAGLSNALQTVNTFFIFLSLFPFPFLFLFH